MINSIEIMRNVGTAIGKSFEVGRKNSNSMQTALKAVGMAADATAILFCVVTAVKFVSGLKNGKR